MINDRKYCCSQHTAFLIGSHLCALFSSPRSAPRNELDIGVIKLVTINVIFCQNHFLSPCSLFPLKKKKKTTTKLELDTCTATSYFCVIESQLINCIVCASQHKKLVIFLVTASYNHIISSCNAGLLNYTINKNFPSFNICSKTVRWVHESRKKRNVHLSHELNQCKPQILINYLGYQNLLLLLLY